jgi:la-related protein 1
VQSDTHTMVSPSVSTARVPPLSYADRAKKAQNIKSPNSVPPPHTVVHSAPPSGSNTSTASGSTALSNSSASQSNSNPTSVDITPSSSIILTTRPSSPLPHTADVPDIKPMNGDLRATKDLTPKSPSTAAAQSSPQKLPPTVNVWSLRKEQMAAQAQAARTPSTQSMPQISKPPVVSRNPATPRPPPSRPYSDKLPNGPHGLSSIKSNHGLTSPVVMASDDPFVVRLPAQNSRAPRLPLPIPAVDDTESWPEVGKSLSSTATPSLHNPAVMDVLPGTKDEGESTKGPEAVKPVSVTPRKSAFIVS